MSITPEEEELQEPAHSGAGAGMRGAGVLAVAAMVAILFGGGTLLRPSVADPPPEPEPVIGRTNVVCPAPPSGGDARSVLQAIVNPQESDRPGKLSATPVGADKVAFELTELGKGAVRSAPKDTVIITGEGGMATASSAATLTNGSGGVNAGLIGATCSKPATRHVFPGIGARSALRTELVITNPDETPAQVDLKFYGHDGLVPVPGGPGIEVEGRQSRVIGIDSMITVKETLTVEAVASRGRVSVMARDYRAKDEDPRGADWHTASATPDTDMIIPGVPDGPGARQLAVVNPGRAPARVSISALGLQGEFVPAGGDQVDVPAESTALVDLGPGLIEQAAAIRLTSDQPVTGSVRSDAPSRDDAGDKVVPDFSVQAAAQPLREVGILPFIGEQGLESQLLLSHTGGEPIEARVEVISLSGVAVKTELVTLAPSSTVSRSVSSPLPAYVMIRVPENSGVYAGLVQRRTGNDDVAGITSYAVSSPDVAARIRPADYDPWTAR